MLTINFLELFDRFLRILFGVEEIESLVVEPVSRQIRRRVVFLGEKIDATAGTEARCE